MGCGASKDVSPRGMRPPRGGPVGKLYNLIPPRESSALNAIRDQIPIGKGANANRQREELWKRIDSEKSGGLSLPTIEKGLIREVRDLDRLLLDFKVPGLSPSAAEARRNLLAMLVKAYNTTKTFTNKAEKAEDERRQQEEIQNSSVLLEDYLAASGNSSQSGRGFNSNNNHQSRSPSQSPLQQGLYHHVNSSTTNGMMNSGGSAKNSPNFWLAAGKQGPLSISPTTTSLKVSAKALKQELKKLSPLSSPLVKNPLAPPSSFALGFADQNETSDAGGLSAAFSPTRSGDAVPFLLDGVAEDGSDKNHSRQHRKYPPPDQNNNKHNNPLSGLPLPPPPLRRSTRSPGLGYNKDDDNSEEEEERDAAVEERSYEKDFSRSGGGDSRATPRTTQINLLGSQTDLDAFAVASALSKSSGGGNGGATNKDAFYGEDDEDDDDDDEDELFNIKYSGGQLNVNKIHQQKRSEGGGPLGPNEGKDRAHQKQQRSEDCGGGGINNSQNNVALSNGSHSQSSYFLSHSATNSKENNNNHQKSQHPSSSSANMMGRRDPSTPSTSRGGAFEFVVGGRVSPSVAHRNILLGGHERPRSPQQIQLQPTSVPPRSVSPSQFFSRSGGGVGVAGMVSRTPNIHSLSPRPSPQQMSLALPSGYGYHMPPAVAPLQSQIQSESGIYMNDKAATRISPTVLSLGGGDSGVSVIKGTKREEYGFYADEPTEISLTVVGPGASSYSPANKITTFDSSHQQGLMGGGGDRYAAPPMLPNRAGAGGSNNNRVVLGGGEGNKNKVISSPIDSLSSSLTTLNAAAAVAQTSNVNSPTSPTRSPPRGGLGQGATSNNNVAAITTTIGVMEKSARGGGANSPTLMKSSTSATTRSPAASHLGDGGLGRGALSLFGPTSGGGGAATRAGNIPPVSRSRSPFIGGGGGVGGAAALLSPGTSNLAMSTSGTSPTAGAGAALSLQQQLVRKERSNYLRRDEFRLFLLCLADYLDLHFLFTIIFSNEKTRTSKTLVVKETHDKKKRGDGNKTTTTNKNSHFLLSASSLNNSSSATTTVLSLGNMSGGEREVGGERGAAGLGSGNLVPVLGNIDAMGNNRVSLESFALTIPLLKEWGLEIDSEAEENPQMIFTLLDIDGEGFVLYKRYCEWAVQEHILAAL